MRPVVLAPVAAAIAAMATILIARVKWRRETAAARKALGGASGPKRRVDPTSLAHLPPPVRRYFEAVLPLGQTLIRRAILHQTGQFLLKPTEDGWRRFDAIHEIAVRPPGFVWDARIRMMPGVTVYVRDAFVGGAGSMVARVLGVFTVADAEGGTEVDQGELHRYLAEAVWAPTALLPQCGVEWTSVDDKTASASLTVGGTVVSLDFHFGPDDLVHRVYTPARMRDVQGRFDITPWQGRFERYERRGGVLIPTSAEVEWVLPTTGAQVYWRGEIGDVIYDSPGPA